MYRKVVQKRLDKKARGDICAHFLCFSTDFFEIFSTSFFSAGGLNGALITDLTLLDSAQFALHSAHFALFFKLFCFSR
jgi:hypothetical protein